MSNQVKPDLDISDNNEEAFRFACIDGHLHVAQWLLQVKPDLGISGNNEEAFRWACHNGHLSVAQWLLQVKPDLDISANNEEAFRVACINGHLSIAQWLLQVKPDLDISANNEFAFRFACSNGHLVVAQWLIQNYDNRSNQSWTLTQYLYVQYIVPLFSRAEEEWKDVAAWVLSKNPEWDLERAEEWGVGPNSYVLK